MAYTLGWVATDWTIDSGTGNIRYIGNAHGGVSPSYVTVIDFHRALQNFADDAAAAGDDILDISSQTPSERSTDNIITLLNSFNIDATAGEHLYDGSIIQLNGTEIYDGVVNFGNAKYILVHQNGAVLNDTTDFWNSYAADATANYTFPPNNTQAGVSHNFLVKVRTGGADIDGRYLYGLTREFGNTYSEFIIQGTSRGNNVFALSESDDLNNGTVAGTVATWDKFSNAVEGFDNTQDINLDATNEEYYSRWTIGAGTLPVTPVINDLYEYTKYIARRGTVSTLYGLPADLFRGVTHEVSYTGLTGTIDDSNPVTFAGGAIAQVLADNGTNTMWVQLLTGTTATMTGGITQTAPDAASATTGTVTSHSISATFLGASTGSAIIGAYGIGAEGSNLSASDSLTDLGTNLISPPNNVTYNVTGLVAAEDRLLVGPRSGSVLDTTQFTLAAALIGAATTSVQVNTAIPSDTPTTGTIRVVNNSGFHVLLTYTSFTGDTFTINAYNFSGTAENAAANIGNGTYITYIDKLAASATESFTVVYLANRDLFIRVRDGGGTPIKTFEAPGTLNTSGGSISAIRTSDE